MLDAAIEAERLLAQWQLKVGQGKHTDKACNITLPGFMKCSEYTVDGLIETIYPEISSLMISIYHPANYFSKHTVQTSFPPLISVMERIPC